MENVLFLSVDGNDNEIATAINANRIIFTIKDTKLYVPIVTLSTRDNQKLSKILSKVFERSIYCNEYKTKSENKITTNEYRQFLESNFEGVNRLFVLVYINRDDASKRFKAKMYYLPKGFIYSYHIIMNGKKLFGLPIHSDIKLYEEIRKLTSNQGEDYTTGCLLEYEYIKNHYRLIEQNGQ